MTRNRLASAPMRLTAVNGDGPNIFDLDPSTATYDPSLVFPEVPIGYGLTAQIVWLTREIASEFKACQARSQRKQMANNFESISGDIREGRWVLNGEPIIIDSDGFMIDGGHRCDGVIAEGKPIPILVIRGVPPESFIPTNSGAVRRDKDVLFGVINREVVAEAAKFLRRYELKLIRGQGQTRYIKLSKMVIREIIQDHPGLQESSVVSAAAGHYCRRKGAMAFCHYILNGIDPDYAASFFDRLSGRADIPNNDPVLTLRRRFAGDVPFDREDAIIFTFKTWNACRSGRSLGVIKWTASENFPYPI